MSPSTDESRPLAAPAEEPPPETIGRYRILGRLGRGGMGTVYKAHDPQLDRVVALKLPRFDGPPDQRALRMQRFQREARAAAQVWHSHVCPIFDVGEHDGQPFVVMAYVEGQSLARRLAGEPRYEDVGAAVAVVRQALDGLEAVHARGIIHRDLKPGNILLDPSGRAILTDFGLVKPGPDAEPLTSDGVVLGTPHYMAPEQAAGQLNRLGPWTDLYSLGVVLYRMLTGHLPFEGPPLPVLSQIVHEPVPPPSHWRPDLDPALERVVRKATAKEPGERYQSAREFTEALRVWLHGKVSPAVCPVPADGQRPLGCEHSRTTETSDVRPRHRPRWQVGLLIGMAQLPVGAGLYAGYLYRYQKLNLHRWVLSSQGLELNRLACPRAVYRRISYIRVRPAFPGGEPGRMAVADPVEPAVVCGKPNGRDRIPHESIHGPRNLERRHRRRLPG
jgi:serine/threonine protein kinase